MGNHESTGVQRHHLLHEWYLVNVPFGEPKANRISDILKKAEKETLAYGPQQEEGVTD
ncbi:hypothetical protein [Lacrimispora sp.]|jgi:hypothetical protein|uniref:hypothetical protein n=1 Tax=Lacrimispora sp. TaxID=2719234 RepID=UPI0028A03266|nr:hypothetical protein [Lacrimispora sp.]